MVVVPVPFMMALLVPLIVRILVFALAKTTGSPLLAVATSGMVPPLVNVKLVPFVGEVKETVCVAGATITELLVIGAAA
jgi:hypothetical protein